MNPEYISIYGYVLLTKNIFTLLVCFGSAILWGSLCLYEDTKPKYYKFILKMFAASLVAILANSFALARMFDSFLIVHLSINKTIIQNTLIDRAGMLLTFGILFSAAISFRKIFMDDED